MDLGLSGKRFVVTGGTRGIGRAVVEGLLAEGAAVAFCARTPESVSATQQELAADGATVVGTPVDVGDGTAVADWVARSAETLGGLDGVVANVSALAIPESHENWRTSFEVDMMGTVGLVDAALPYLLKSEAGSIVTISSVSGREIDFAAGPYGTFKAAIIHYTQGLAYQLAAQGVRANTVSPGNTYFPGGVWPTIEKNDPELFAASLALNPTGRMATPREIANAVVFLSSPAASFITGTNLVVDGALTRGVQF
ncbi:SDR family NAD(P)-dependent oxidoreductase [Mycolicibacterium goodii]|uniref:SDR family oxidoreductase n=1 Tax=Mycolicibacterium goodii TaxID=134601 RepID=A0ABS6HYF3_MYCGD|nr:SDR family NAD(P)-dependent oxidoreductase [Mycolicibacterium goodii]OKH66043.1 3-ketoacyl-ACP reductase [Mycobacterium sp. SWH-M5]MBU8812356.1 SDR family oxidoreductase [Mycolicibacterium goodii]MBU8819873.1 SDR family oxidoreductase [Mycolicibacterium goodii]MBU8827321.1 SDR family oxidoreductase [Mycolicibacterium goodii]MBU8833933.1 SDR family oxidoreductase [Mycolicibacterium goodii]